METTYINVSPKWSDLVHTLIELSTNSRNAESKKVATDNLLKMAQAADLWNEHCKSQHK
jgi:hypothetical protein